MYIPKEYAITDQQAIEAFLHEHRFATLITQGITYPMATHTPMMLETNRHGKKVLRGHISKANSQWQMFEQHPDVLVSFFSGIHHYISSSWYTEPEVPTWNYLAAQVCGIIRLRSGDALWRDLEALTNCHENLYAKAPISLPTLPQHVKDQVKGIVGFEVTIDKMELSFKLSQNRTEADFTNILKQLRLNGSLTAKAMADVMEKNHGMPGPE